ncbi:uncharacterized protein K441DRAFT_717187 [Cenococcum geophilum 1.58]|uniref:uncharacterized protein n=1 Tax=Cenococcum geophilum 1.58 TaxID=794803 RepID=UPI00358F9708|nr:hypothetical protein K441DRAFT_717187 [Cenococcum geophilum 1.58]
MPHTTVSTIAIVDDNQIDVVPLETIDFARLVAKESREIAKLLRAAESSGFFYLDFRNDSTKHLLEDLPEVYVLSERYFDQSHEVEMMDYREGQPESQDCGYKKSDCDETFEGLSTTLRFFTCD